MSDSPSSSRTAPLPTLDDLAWAIGSGRFGIQSLGRVFSEPAPRTAKDVPIVSTYRGVIPFVISDIVRTAIMTMFPAISLFLIRWMY